MIHSNEKIPEEAEWAGYEGDLDAEYAHDLLYGKSIIEVQKYFGENRSIERASELHFMPRHAFQYYIFAFASFLHSENARGDPDSASPFLSLLLEREKADPGSVSQIYSKLASTIEFVAANQEYFGADQDIYGSFAELALEIQLVCEVSHGLPNPSFKRDA